MSKITKSAKGQDCQIRMPGVCNFDPRTTVFCHEPDGSGMGTKWPDSEGAYGCSACHAVLDRRAPPPIGTDWRDVRIDFYEGARRTRIKLIEMGLIKLS